jgi:rRNA maturation RNase YbeY
MPTIRSQSHKMTNSSLLVDVIVQIDDQNWKQWKSEEEWASFFKDISLLVFDFFHLECFIEISVLLTNDRYIQTLNHRYRDKEKSTNVLSFPQISMAELMHLTSDAPVLLGDIVMSFETITKEAEDQNKLLMNHIIHLYIHSLLHLLGYDHIDEEDAIEMETMEANFLKTLGIQNPYH